MANTQTERNEFESPHGIDFAWETTTGLPESLGWTLNHILAMLAADNYRGTETVDKLRDNFIATIGANPAMAIRAYDDVLTQFILGTYLRETLRHIPKSADITELGKRIARLVRLHRSGAQIHSQDWKNIRALLRVARGRAANRPNMSHRNALDFILKAFTWATKDETPTTCANILREIANANACVGGSQISTYEDVAQELLSTMRAFHKKDNPQQNTGKLPHLSRRSVKLLRKLGTFTPVKNVPRI